MWTPSIFPHLTTWAKATVRDIDYEFEWSHPFALIGILVFVYAVERAFDFVLFHFATPHASLQAYKRRGPKPTYALVTGASAGIGFGIAKALVKQGFGVIILGHKQDELAEAAAALRAALVLPEDDEDDGAAPITQAAKEAFVKTIVMDAITATPEEMEETLRAAIVDQELRVSILVNNVGSLPIAMPSLRHLATYSPDDIDKTIAVNARFPTRLTTLMLPVLAHRGAGVDKAGYAYGTHRRSLVLNIGSGGMTGLAYLVLHSATKAFNWSFSRGLARELALDPATRHIDVLAVLPGDVRSCQGSQLGPPSRWAPSAEVFGRCVVAKTEAALSRGWREMHPHWFHHLQAIAMGLGSERAVAERSTDSMVAKKEA